nr:MAG TPA: hypothetical protein [Caudoviricetes sp.]
MPFSFGYIYLYIYLFFFIIYILVCVHFVVQFDVHFADNVPNLLLKLGCFYYLFVVQSDVHFAVHFIVNIQKKPGNNPAFHSSYQQSDICINCPHPM